MQESIQLVIESLPYLLKGAVFTLQLSIGGMFFGLLLGFVLALMRMSPLWPVRWLARFYISIFRGTPLIAQLFMIYYGLPQFGIELDPIPAAMIGLSLNTAAYTSETLRAAISAIDNVGEACCGEDAVKWCRTNAVDVVLMDMNMPGIGGLEATRKIARSTADIKVIMLTVHTENPLPAKVMQAGAAGYLSKGAAPQEVVSAIRSVYSGQRYIASDIAQQMALSQIEPAKTETPFASLSERELQIMLMITKGQKVNEISEQLNLSPKTVNSYRYRMFSKLNIHGDVELTHLAIRHGLCNAETLTSQ